MKITVTFDSLEEFTQALRITPETEKKPAAAPAKKAAPKKTKKDEDPALINEEDLPAVGMTPAPVPPEQAHEEPVYSKADVAKAASVLLRQKPQLREQIKVALEACGTDTLPNLPEDKVMEFAKALKAMGGL